MKEREDVGAWARAELERRVGPGVGGKGKGKGKAEEGDAGSKSVGLGTMETLLEAVAASRASTMQELRAELGRCVEGMRGSDLSTASVASASELFIRFISLGWQAGSFEECRRTLVERGRLYLGRAGQARRRIAQLSGPLLGGRPLRLLTHSHSRVVELALVEAAKSGRPLEVLVTQSLPDNSGLRMKAGLERAGVSATLIVDGAAAYVMEGVDAVVVGAEGVVETGGVLNKVGTYGVALAAKAHHKPLYVLAESFKFLRDFPLSQAHIPDVFKYKASTLASGHGTEKEHPLVDYTPAHLISLLVTDLGLLTPAAVSDQLINLYL